MGPSESPGAVLPHATAARPTASYALSANSNTTMIKNTAAKARNATNAPT